MGEASIRPKIMSASARVAWMDVLRGLLVLLVIFFHAARNSTLAYYGSGHHPLIYQFITMMAPFRMPGLMLLSGILVERSLAKGVASYFIGKTRHVLYPFVVWAVVIPIVSTGFTVIASGGIGAFLLDAVSGGGGVNWYLWFLYLSYVIFYFVRKVPIGIVIALSLVLSSAFTDFSGFLTWFLFLFAFFATGIFVSRHFEKLTTVIRSPITLVIAGVPAVAFSFYTLQGLERKNALYAPWVLCGVVALMSISYFAAKLTIVQKTLGFVGRHSLIYYVMQIMLIANFAVLVTALNLPMGTLRLAIVLILTIATSTLAVWLTRKLPPLNIFFVMPWLKRRDAQSGMPRRQVDFGA